MAASAPQAVELTEKQRGAALGALLRSIADIERQRLNAETDRDDATRTLDKCGIDRATLERDVFKLGFSGRAFILDVHDGKPPLVIIVHAAAVEIREAERL